MKKFTLVSICLAIFMAGCTTTQSVQAVKVEEQKEIKGNGQTAQNENGKAVATKTEKTNETLPSSSPVPTPEPIIEKYVIVEKPVMVGETSYQSSKNLSPEEEASKLMDSNNGGIMEYDYIPEETYPIFTQPNRITDLCLQPGEFFEENSIITGDSKRWMFESGLSNSNGIKQQHLYIKPIQDGLETTLIINTTQRIYRMLVRSYKTKYMSVVQFRYRLGNVKGQFVDLKKENGGSILASEADRYNFGYKVTYIKGKKPKWLPTVVMDDGAKTYIYLPKEVLNAEVPGVFENNSDIINYRLRDNMLVIDKVADKLTLKYNGTAVTITKL